MHLKDKIEGSKNYISHLYFQVLDKIVVILFFLGVNCDLSFLYWFFSILYKYKYRKYQNDTNETLLMVIKLQI